MNRILILLTLTLAACFSSFAQGVVSGKVVDSNNEPMPGVRVEIAGRNEVAYTDIDGVFSIDVPVKVSKVIVSYPGFKPTTRKIKPDMVIKMGSGWESHDRGYRGFFDWNIGFGFGGKTTIGTFPVQVADIRPSVEFGITTSHGYQVNRNLYVGLGAGLNIIGVRAWERGVYGSYWDYDYGYVDNNLTYYEYSEVPLTYIQIPLFVDLRWDFGLGNRVSPFIGLKIGYQLNFSPDQDYDLFYTQGSYGSQYHDLSVQTRTDNGFFLQPSIGLRRSLGSKVGLNLGLSMNIFAMTRFSSKEVTYNPQGLEYLETYDYKKSTGSILMFDFGFDF